LGIKFFWWNGEGLELNGDRIEAGILDYYDFMYLCALARSVTRRVFQGST